MQPHELAKALNATPAPPGFNPIKHRHTEFQPQQPAKLQQLTLRFIYENHEYQAELNKHSSSFIEVIPMDYITLLDDVPLDAVLDLLDDWKTGFNTQQLRQMLS